MGKKHLEIKMRFYGYLSIFTDKFDDKRYELLHEYETYYTELGRTVFSFKMASPLIRSLNYADLGRRLVTVDELPQGAYARYQKDVTTTANELIRDQLVADPNLIVVIPEEGASEEDVRRVQEQLAQTPNDPDFTIVTSSGFQFTEAERHADRLRMLQRYERGEVSPQEVLTRFGFDDVIGEIDIAGLARINMEVDMKIEEQALSNYLLMMKELKLQKYVDGISEIRKRKNSIQWLEIGG